MVMKRACKRNEYSKPEDDICIRIHPQTHAQKCGHTHMNETQNIFVNDLPASCVPTREPIEIYGKLKMHNNE